MLSFVNQLSKRLFLPTFPAIVFWATSHLSAELPSPRLDRITPVGGAAGNTVSLTLAGSDLEGVESLWLDHAGIRAEFVKVNEFKLTIAADVPTGTYDVRGIGKYGITNPRLFAVCRGLSDIAEVEPNNSIVTAQAITVNSSISGTADGNGQDFFAVVLKAGQRVVVDCQSARLDTEMDPILTLFAASGSQLASNGDYYGRDPFLDFIAPTDGTYVVELRDLIYRGGFPYRLLIHNRPQIENVFPRAVQAGQSALLQLFGRNLGPNSQPSTWMVNGLTLDQLPFEYTAPADLPALGAYRFREHPTHHSVLPTAATCTLVGEQIAPLDANPQTIMVTEFPTTVEAEPNDSRERPQLLSLPIVVSGRFDKPMDADWYQFETDDKGGNYGLDVYCERIGGRADPYLVLIDEQQNRTSELDDFGHRRNAFDGHLRDPSGMVSLQPKKKYRVLVQDRYKAGGARSQYVLSIRKATPDFFTAVIPWVQLAAAGTTVWQGSSTSMDIIVHQRDGHQEPILVTAEELPPGLHLTPTYVTNDSFATLVFWADENAPPWTGRIRLIATSRRGDEVLRHEIQPYSRVQGNVGSRVSRELIVAIRERGPYSLRVSPESATVESGQKLDVKLHAQRFWPDFQGAINFQPLNFPGPFQLGSGIIGNGSSEAAISIMVQPNTRPGTYTLVVQGQSQVPFNKDAEAKERPNTLVTIPSVPLTITVTEPPKKP